MATTIDSTPKLLLNQREAAESLGISERSLWGLTEPRGPIPAVRVGRSVRYRFEALRRWVEDKEAAAV
jgi:excisionase family DNA binding protein